MPSRTANTIQWKDLQEILRLVVLNRSCKEIVLCIIVIPVGLLLLQVSNMKAVVVSLEIHAAVASIRDFCDERDDDISEHMAFSLPSRLF